MPVEQRRDELTEAALQVMRREGAWTLTTRAVAAQADVSHGSVHYAFSSKEALLQAVLDADTERALVSFGAAAAGVSVDDALTRAFVGYTDAIKADPMTELVLQELFLMGCRHEALRPSLSQSHTAYRIGVEQLLTTLAQRHDGCWDAPVPVIAGQLLGVMFGCATSWLFTRDDALLDAMMSDAARVFAARLRPVST